MSVWAQVQKLPEELQQQVSLVYNEHFPIEVRTVLAEWIENQPWDKIDYDNPEHEKFATALVSNLVQQMNILAQNIENPSLKYRLNQVAVTIQNNYFRDPISLVRLINSCLNSETKILQHAQSETKPIIKDSFQDIARDVIKLRQDVQDTEIALRKLVQDQEQLILHLQERHKYQTLLQSSGSNGDQRVKLSKNLEQYETTFQTLMKQRGSLVDRCRDTISAFNIVLTSVLEGELERWRRGQQLAGNGVVYSGYSLDEIQDWCESLAELIWQTRVQIKRMQLACQNYNPSQFLTDSLFSLMEMTSVLLQQLIRSTFVIEKQPPQVMKTNTRFTATVRLLVGCKLNVHMTPPNVSVYIISEHQAAMMASEAPATLSQNDTAAGEILNNTGIMEFHSATQQLSVHFRNMQLKKIKRTEKKGTESVMDEKFALMFYSRFNVCGGELGEIHIRVRTFSLPVVVIVHGNQEPHAHATITWDNAFAEPGRTSFAVPDKVPFIRVGEVLSQKFMAHVGHGLNEDNLRFLAAKALRTSSVPDLNTPITWSQFSKEPLPERSFTFWEWFYAVLKVTKEHLRSLWNDGLIMGFVWRKQAEDMLANCQPGTCLLRFSDSELGGLTVAWKSKAPDGISDEFFMLQPFTCKDLSIRGLADRLSDLKNLNFLYPDIPKDSAFSKYYTPISDNSKTNTGYVKPLLVTCVPGVSGMSCDTYPNTPQSTLHPHSPGDSNSMSYEPSVNRQSMDSNCGSVKQNGTHATQFDMMEYLQDSTALVPIDFSNETYNY